MFKSLPIYCFVIGLFAGTLLLIAPANGVAQSGRKTVYQQYYHSMQPDSVVPGIQLTGRGGTIKPPTIEKSPRRFKVLGRFGAHDTLRYTIPISDDHSWLTVDLAFHIVGSWDGVQDNDRLTVRVDGKEVFSESFSNTTYRQSYPAATTQKSFPARTGARNKNMLGYRFVEPNVYDGPLDATYQLERTDPHSRAEALVEIFADLKDMKPGLENESWALEHLVLYVDYNLPSSIAPTRIKPKMLDQEIVEFTGPDVRCVAGYRQDEDFPGLEGGFLVPLDVHARSIQTRCTSCGEVCLMYTYTVYTDGWVNVWNYREAKGEATFWCMLEAEELDSVNALIDACLSITMESAYKPSDIGGGVENHGHCDVLLRNFKIEKVVSVDSGEPIQLTILMQYMMSTLAKHGWTPTPF